MNKIYLLAHVEHRFVSDCVYTGTFVGGGLCNVCGRGLSRLTSPLLYYWDREFGSPTLSMSQGHQFFWASLLLLATQTGRQCLEELGLAFDFQPAKRIPDPSIRQDVVDDERPLCWVRPTHIASADETNENEICPECGQFVTQPRQLTRLKVAQSKATTGVFSVRENAGEPIFVTSEVRTLLHDALGIRCYPAGAIVGK